MKKYIIERDGQIEFFKNYGIPYEDDNSILVDNTDGVYNGNILEFKLNISNPNKVLLQAIKYLSKMRLKGESIPATILLIGLNDEKVYEYKSEDYRNDIQKVYTGSASRDNSGFVAGKPSKVYDYSNMVESNNLKKQLKGAKSISDMYMPIDIDENCIVGWAERYYRDLPKASKGDFLGDETGVSVKLTGEIRNPRHFEGLINKYEGVSNEKFKYLMDCLNDRLSKKDLGAFYTPIPYAKKAAELVVMAVDRVPEGNDYIILDRCAGTGNLEAALMGIYDKNGDELISHCVVSTYEYYEYKVLNERMGDLVREIIPPTEADVVYANGKVSNADALSEDFINNPIIKDYVDNPKCTIILFENPPFTESNGNTKATGLWKKSYVVSEMKKDVSGVATNDLTNVFIWSGFKYYLKNDTDSYVLFSPIKYWKAQHLVNKTFKKGFIFNRKKFHATAATALACILWNNKDANAEELVFTAYDIGEDNECVIVKDNYKIKRIHTKISSLYDKTNHPNDTLDGIACSLDGTERQINAKTRIKTKYNDNIICYIVANMAGFETPRLNSGLVRVGRYDSNGSFVRKENYLDKLPLFVATKYYIEDSWIENGTIYKSADLGNKYVEDKDLLKCCFIYTCLSYYNKCLTFEGSDGRHYQNELCFDKNTLASKDLATMKLDKEEQELLQLWDTILEEARTTGKCNPDWTYGVYQISKEINTYKEVGTDKNKKKVYDYPQLNGDLDTLRTKLKNYYKTHITEKMFKYELLK